MFPILYLQMERIEEIEDPQHAVHELEVYLQEPEDAPVLEELRRLRRKAERMRIVGIVLNKFFQVLLFIVVHIVMYLAIQLFSNLF